MNRRLKIRIENGEPVYVNPPFEERWSFMYFIRANDFKCVVEQAWDCIEDSVLPIVLDFNKKEYSCMETVSDATAAASSDLIFTDRDLYEYFGVPVDMRFKQFRNEVKEHLQKYGYSEEEIEDYLSESVSLQVLINNFEAYTRHGMPGCEPCATASCLDLMY